MSLTGAVARLSANREWKSSALDNALQLSFDVSVVGGGPAGLAAAVTVAEAGMKVALVDDNPKLGGQIWRAGRNLSPPKDAASWLERLAKSGVRVMGGTRVFHASRGVLAIETDEAVAKIYQHNLVLATGAREFFLPFPGWTLPNVVGAGGLQALVKSGLPINGKRVVVAGTGPLLLAVAAHLNDHDAEVVCISEQASMSSLAAFGVAMAAFPKKMVEAVGLRLRTYRTQYRTNSWPVAALGAQRLEAVRIVENGRVREIKCDYLACGYHLVPNTELAQLLRCRLSEGFVEIDELQQTSQPGVYCAGEPTGIGGSGIVPTRRPYCRICGRGSKGRGSTTLAGSRTVSKGGRRDENGIPAPGRTNYFVATEYLGVPL